MKIIRHKCGAVTLESELLRGTAHGFSTRIGSGGERPMNLRLGQHDTEDVVRENLALFAEAVGFDAQLTVAAKQVHSTHILRATREDGGKYYLGGDVREYDGFVTRERGVALAVGSADCVPILLYDPVGCVIGAVHAGWRGTVKGIVCEAICEMIALGSVAKNIRVAIGPCIHDCCFEVKGDVTDAILALGDEFSDCIKERDGKTYADLVKTNEKLLMASGVRAEHIDTTALCTSCRRELFYSHRRDGIHRGTMIAAICLK